MEEGLRRGWDVFLVLEDDICLRDVSSDFWGRLSSLIFEEDSEGLSKKAFEEETKERLKAYARGLDTN